MPTTIGQIIVNEALPPKYRDYNRTIGADELEDLLTDIIKNDPDAFKDVSAKLVRIGNKAAYEGGTTVRLSDIAPPVDNSAMYRDLDIAEGIIRGNRSMTEEQKSSAIADLYQKVYDGTKKQAYETSLASGNSFAMQVKSKARGNQDQLSAMINTPGIYKDPSGRTVPLFIRHSFAEGLSPAEYWAGTYGARTGVVSTKFATAVSWCARKRRDSWSTYRFTHGFKPRWRRTRSSTWRC
jgi:DNA-directed RNA polymerase subunit beta'